MSSEPGVAKTQRLLIGACRPHLLTEISFLSIFMSTRLSFEFK